MINFHSSEQAFWHSISIDHYSSQNVKAYISPVTEVQSFNLCYIYEGADINEITNVLNWYDAKSRDCMIICPEGHPHSIIQSHQAEWQLEDEGPTTAMLLELDQWQAVSNSVDDFTVKLSNDDLSFWSYPLLTAFGSGNTLQDAIIIQQYQKAHELALQKDFPLYHFALMHNNVPICSLTLTIMDQGAEYCVLEVSSDGLSVYQKLGFKALWNYHTYFKSHSILK